MGIFDISFILVILSALLTLFLSRYVLRNKPITQIQRLTSISFICLFIMCIGLIVQKICAVFFHANPVYFEGFVYLGTCFLPVVFFLVALSFSKTKIVFTKKYALLFVIPILTLLILWTNNFHHLFYQKYSFDLNEMMYGPYAYIHLAYTYGLFAVGIAIMLRHTVKNSGFFSKQSLLIIVGVSIPVIVNILGSFNIIHMDIYTTPISFIAAIICISFSIFKFHFSSITPIALEKIVDRMSDCYIVLNEQNVIVDFNKPFLSVFNTQDNKIRNHNVFDIDKNISFERLQKAIQSVSLSSKTASYEAYVKNIKKYFNVEVSSIIDKGNFLGTLILFKDVTQHESDLKTIKDNQDMLVERERFASLGQMIGGIAHNLKTPIMSIAGATEALTDLINEYDASIGDDEVTFEDHHEIAKEMSSWIAKIKTHTAYMSDVITAVKGQAISSNESVESFTIDDLIKRVSILMKHELKHSLVELNYDLSVDNNFTLHGNINALVQVIDNLISNAIQSYNGQPDNVIDFITKQENNSLIISIRDYGSGMSKDVQNKLFKEMITTKGKNGTGLGLFMSYSNIKAKFNGNITFESEVGKGTTFNIIIPCEKNIEIAND